MANTAKQSPLGVNATASLLQNKGLTINPVSKDFLGESKNNDLYVPGKLINDTCLLPLTYAIHNAYSRSAKDSVSEWHTVTDPSWGTFMNNYAIWSGSDTELTYRSRYASVSFGTTSMYTFEMAASNYMSVIMDYDTPVYIGVSSTSQTKVITIRVPAGTHTISMIIGHSEGTYGGGALRITNLSGTEIWNSTYGVPVSEFNGDTISNENYEKLISIGKDVIPALGNTPPNTYTNYDPSKNWWGQATTGYYLLEDMSYAQGQSQTATWLPLNCTNTNKSVTQWGYYRLFALQAWNEFNWNGEPTGSDMPEYKDFVSSFLTVDSFVKYTNTSINTFKEGPQFLEGTYSNINDLITSDITGVNLATKEFGIDCIVLGRAIDLSKIEYFGLPSALLQTIRKNKILTQALSYALVAAGLTINEINNIASGAIDPVPIELEQKIYGAYLIIMGIDLAEILFALNCKTQGLDTLADLLNVKKIFPNSYKSLTVPLYNATPGPTNSKTYYPIFSGDNVSSMIQSPQIVGQITGVSILGAPTLSNTSQPNAAAITELINSSASYESGNVYNTLLPFDLTTSLDKLVTNAALNAIQQNDPVKFNDIPKGFGSYLENILPNDIGVSAGAFSIAMQQIKNITLMDFEKFSQVVFALETAKGLDLINGTNVPVNIGLSDEGYGITALGSGPYGTYTMSDFSGCMSGLPYPWTFLYQAIVDIQTEKLRKIYNQLYLAVSWEEAILDVTYTEYDIGLDTYYTITGVTITNGGGGYGRNDGPVPVITINGGSGATATCTIGTDPNNILEYGKITSVTLTSPGTDVTTIPTATIECPSTAYVSYPYTGGTNTPAGTNGWAGASGSVKEPMNSVVSLLINDANNEISNIKTANVDKSDYLNTLHNNTGTQLTIEQRSRFFGLTPVPQIRRDMYMASYPDSLISFTDALSELCKNTLPHMTVQTLEAISDLSLIGGQSIVGVMREFRNTYRLQALGADLDNNVPPALNPKEELSLLLNGSVANSAPSFALNVSNNEVITPIPTESFDGTNVLTNQNVTFGNPTLNQPTLVPTGSTSILDVGKAPPGSLAPSKAINLLPPNLKFISGTTLPSTFSVGEAIDEVIKCNCDCWVQ